ncbi:MAG: hypothetical protein NWF07_09550 [Candidatus Bathyarchaeota archaeon]|nr:hypothetical protein [Candidatus Bathyarchaeota archaeon]
MRRVVAELSDTEAKAFFKKMKGDETIREYLLRLAGVDAKPRRVGRPPRTSLDMLGRPGRIRTTDGTESRKELGDLYGKWKE